MFTFTFAFWHFLLSVSVAAKWCSGLESVFDAMVVVFLCAILVFGATWQSTFWFRLTMTLTVFLFLIWNLVHLFNHQFSDCGCFGNVNVSIVSLVVMELVSLPMMVGGVIVVRCNGVPEAEGRSSTVLKQSFFTLAATLFAIVITVAMIHVGVLHAANAGEVFSSGTLGANDVAIKISHMLEDGNAATENIQPEDDEIFVFVSNSCRYCKSVVPKLLKESSGKGSWMIVEVNGKPLKGMFASGQCSRSNVSELKLPAAISISGMLPQIVVVRQNEINARHSATLDARLKCLLKSLDKIQLNQ